MHRETVPHARTRQEAEVLERQLVEQFRADSDGALSACVFCHDQFGFSPQRAESIVREILSKKNVPSQGGSNEVISYEMFSRMVVPILTDQVILFTFVFKMFSRMVVPIVTDQVTPCTIASC